MVILNIPVPASLPAGEIIAAEVTADEYMAHYAETFHEWVRGNIIKMSPVSERHDLLTIYLRLMLDTYFALKPAGCVRNAPFVMRLESADTFREPDIQVILNNNPGDLTTTAMVGPADICIEVVSPESSTRDYGDKFVQYEEAGVREYWIIDPARQRCDFNRLGDEGVYVEFEPDEKGNYQTPLLPELVLYVPTLWADRLPTSIETVQAVQAMINSD